MTRRRRVLLFGLSAALLMLAVGGWLLLPNTAITPANAANIKPGMTRAEVVAILGGPARSELAGVFAPDFSTGAPKESAARLDAVRKATSLGAEGWYSERFAIWVAFDDSDHVIAIASCPARRFEESFFDKFRRRLRL